MKELYNKKLYKDYYIKIYVTLGGKYYWTAICVNLLKPQYSSEGNQFNTETEAFFDAKNKIEQYRK